MVKPQLIIDHREPMDLIQMLSPFYDVKIRELQVADYVIGNVGIERKSDDYNDIPDVLMKVDELLAVYPAGFLLVDQPEDVLFAKAHPKIQANYIGYKASLTARGIPPIFCRDKAQWVIMFNKLVSKLVDDKVREPHFTVIRPKPKDKDLRINILKSLPRISDSQAKALMHHFLTIQNIANAPIKELEKVDGIGHIHAKRIHKLFH